MKIFRDTMRPAVSTGLSVTRVGGRGQSKRQQAQAGATFKALTAYNQAMEFARFGSELAVSAQQDLAKGQLLYKILNQVPGENYNVAEQTLMLDICLNLQQGEQVNVEALKKEVREHAARLQQDDNMFDVIRDELKSKSLVEVKKAEEKKPEAAPPPATDQKEGEKKEEPKAEEKKEEKQPEGAAK